MASVINWIITGARTISFFPPSSFSYSSAFHFERSISFYYLQLWHLLTHLWWIHKIMTMIAHWECFMETHYRVSISACLSLPLSLTDTYILSVSPVNTKTTEAAQWCEKFGCELSVESSDKAINAWLADTLSEAAVVFLWNPFSDHSDCLFATLGSMLLFKGENSLRWYRFSK